MSGFWGRALLALALMSASGASLSQTTTYRYDALGRVIQATEADGRAAAYGYDAAGNRITLSNGSPRVELTVKAFTASSNAGGFAGLTTSGAMRDQVFNTKASSHVTASEGSAWIQADLGASVSIDRVDLAGPDAAVVAGGASALAGAMMETSDDAAAWTLAATVGAVTPGVYKTVNLRGMKARYVRVRRTGGLVGVGDFRLYSGAELANCSPVVRDDEVETTKGRPVLFAPLANDADPDADDILSITAAGDGARHGEVTFTATSITYKPSGAYVGDDSFSYTVVDTHGASATGNVRVTIKDVPNRPPIIKDASWGVPVNTTNTLSVTAIDPDGDPLKITSVSTTSNGGIVTPLGELTFRYTPPPGFVGQETFVLFIDDGQGAQAQVGSTVRVYSPINGNHDPVAFEDVVTTSRGQALTHDPRGNDTDVDHDLLTITSVQSRTAQEGSVTKAADGSSLTYTPPSAAFTGQDSFTYTIGDGRGGASSAQVTVYVVGMPNRAPQAESFGISTFKDQSMGVDMRLHTKDLDGDVPTIISVTQPAHGTATPYLSGRWITYTPSANHTGGDSFSYTVSDGRGGIANGTISVTVVDAINTPPVTAKNPYPEYTIPPNQSFTFDPTVHGYDTNGDPLTVISAGLDTDDQAYPSVGTLSRSNAGPTNDEILSKYLTYTPPPGQSGFSVKVLYILFDGHGPTPQNAGDGLSEVGAVILHVAAGASVGAPVGQPASLVVAQGRQGSTNLQVVGAHDTVELVQSPSVGSAVVDGLKATYKAPSSFTGDTSFTYRARGVGGAGPTAVVTVRVTEGSSSIPAPRNNVNPVAMNDTVSNVAYATARSIDVLANDRDPDGDPLTIVTTLPQPPSHGRAQVVGSTIIYTPDGGYVGADSFIYGISDGAGGSATATVSLSVLPRTNRAPVAVSDIATLAFGQARAIAVLANDYDPDGDGVLLNSVNPPAHGAASIVNGQIVYTPVAGYAGADSLSYEVIDGRGGRATGAVSITILPRPNTSPTAMADSYVTRASTPAFLAVRDNDSDTDGDPLTLVSVTAPAHGTAVISSGQVTYTPASGYTGPDAFDYTVSDGQGGSASARVELIIKSPINRAPLAVDDRLVMTMNTVRTVNVLANDSDPDGDTLTFADLTSPSHGTASIVGRQIVYTAASGYVGADSFDYAISDGQSAAVRARVSVTIQATNRAPLAADDTVSTAFDTPKAIAVLVNDADPDGDPLILGAVTSPLHGSAIIASDQLIYTPIRGYSGSDRFDYTIGDGRGGTSSASVTVTVETRPNQAPNAVNDAVLVTFETATPIPVLANDNDPENDTLTLTAVTSPAHGTTVLAGGQVTYTPFSGYSGPDGFDYTIRDSQGLTARASVSLTVQPRANRNPVATSDGPIEVTNSTAKLIDALANDTDPDGDVMMITAVGAPANGEAVLVGGQIRYTPTYLYVGEDGFDYTISDGQGGSAHGWVAVRVKPNASPVAVDDVVTTPWRTTKTIPVVANDSDPDGDVLSVHLVYQPENGTVEIRGQSILYTPDPSFSGEEVLRYYVSDEKGGIAYATVRITVGSNANPVAVADLVTTPYDTPVTINILANDSDADGDPLTFSLWVVHTEHGTLDFVGNKVRYTPEPGYAGQDDFGYILMDGRGGSAFGYVKITVQTPNQIPSAANDAVATAFNTAITIPVLANDADPDNDPLTLTAVTNPAHGSAVINGGQVTYTPASGYSGPDSFGYTIGDGRGGTASASVSITVRPANRAPTVVNDVAVAPFETATPIYVLSNDSDADGDTLTLTAVTSPARGTAVINGDLVTYTPASGYSGVDSFNYTVGDGHGLTASASVSLTVQPRPNRNPVAVSDGPIEVINSTAKLIDVLANDSDPDGDVVTISAAGTPENGVTAIVGRQIRYTPTVGYAGSDGFGYAISDGKGGSASGWVALSIKANAQPVAVNDTATTGWRTAKTIPVLANDTDPDGDVLSIQTVFSPENGTAVISGKSIVYTPGEWFTGEDAFSYVATDNKGGFTFATVRITVGSNENPVVVNDVVTTPYETAVTIDVLANDSDADGDPLTLSLAVVQTEHGTVGFVGNKIRYTPEQGYFGPDSFYYYVKDGRGGAGIGSVRVTTQPPPE